MKAINDVKKSNPNKCGEFFWTCAFFASVVSSLVSLWVTCVLRDSPAETELVADPDASYAEEYGVLPPQPESDPNGEVCEFDPDCHSGYVCVEGRCSFSIPEYCNNTDNNYHSTDDKTLAVAFVFDISGSMRPYINGVKRAVSEYVRESSADFFYLHTPSETYNEYTTMSGDRTEFASVVSQIRVNPKVSHEYIPQIMASVSNTDSGSERIAIIAITDEEPQWINSLVYNELEDDFCSGRNNSFTFTVLTTPPNVAAWREVGACIRVYGDL